MELKQTIWATIGFHKYGFTVPELKAVVVQQARIGFVPKGYLYPELHLSPTQPEELLEVMQRKWLHFEKAGLI